MADGAKLDTQTLLAGLGTFGAIELHYNSQSLANIRTGSSGVAKIQTAADYWRPTYGRRLGFFRANSRVLAWVREDNGQLSIYDIAGNELPGGDSFYRKLTSPGGVWRRENGAGEVEIFDSLGRLTSLTKRDGTSVTLNYTNPLQTTLTNEIGRRVIYQYDSIGRLVGVSGGGTTIPIEYDADGRLYMIRYAPNRERTFTYAPTTESGDHRHLLTGVWDEGVRLSRYEYHPTTQKVRSTERLTNGSVAVDRYEFEYGGSLLEPTTAVRDPLMSPQSTPRTYSFSFASRPVAGGLPLGGLRPSNVTQICPTCGSQNNQSTTFDTRGNQKTTTDFRGIITHYTFDQTRDLETQRIEVANGLFGLPACPAGIPDCPSARRTTQTDWHTTLRVPIESRVLRGDANGVLESVTKYEVNSRGQFTAVCLVEPTISAAMNYACGSLANAPAGVRQTRTDYCDTADGDVGSAACPFVGFVRTVDGPRTDANDLTRLTYYDGDSSKTCAGTETCLYRKGDLRYVDRYTNGSAYHRTEFVTYDNAGRVLRQKDANGVITDLTYHARGWLASRTIRANADGTANATLDAVTVVTYDAATAMVDRVTLADGSYLDYDYDGARRLTSITDNLNNRKEFLRDAAGNVLIDKTLENGTLRRRLAQQYNQLGQLERVRDALTVSAQPLGAGDVDNPAMGRMRAEYQYDPNGNRKQALDGLSHDTDYEYDPLNRLKRTLDALRPDCAPGDANCGRTEYSYDSRSNLIQVIDPNGGATDYGFNGLAQQVLLSSPDTGQTVYIHDQAGNRIEQTDARGVKSVYAYDALNRLTSISYPLGDVSRNSNYYYDEANAVTGCSISAPIGRMTRMVDSSGTTKFCYDKRGNLTRKQQSVSAVGLTSVLTIDYTYTLGDRILTMTYPDTVPRVVTYDRDTVGRVSAITVNGAAFITAVQYYPWGPVRSISYAGGKTLTKTLDQNYEIDLISSNRANGLNLNFKVDVAGKVEEVIQGTAARAFSYDPLDRLKLITDGTLPIDSYTYDPLGNRLSSQAGEEGVEEYSYFFGTNWLQSISGAEKAGGGGGGGGNTERNYDSAGNSLFIPSLGKPNLSYDERNRLVLGTNATMQDVGYNYNARGERVLREFYGGGFLTSIYMYTESGAPAVFENFDSGAAGHTYRSVIYLDQLPVGLIDNGTLMALETDHLGTPRVVSDGTNVLWRWELVSGSATAGGSNVFGDQLPNEDVDGNGTPYKFDMRFPGQIYDDATTLHYNYFRDYEPGTGRYVESDPIGLYGGKATYGYVKAQPLRFIDPLGLYECCDNPIYDAVLDIQAMSDRFHEIRVRGHNTFPGHENSFMRHCTASCVLADDYGTWPARMAGVGNEYQGFYMIDIFRLPETFDNRRPWAFDPNDFSANETGFSCSRGNCEKRQAGDDSFRECERCCLLGVMYGL